MKICRFNENRLGVVDGDEVLDVTEALSVLPSYEYPLPGYDPLIKHLDALLARIETLIKDAPRILLADVRLLSPVANPGKIIAAPINYTRHLQEVLADSAINNGVASFTQHIKKSGLFLKANSSLAGAGEGVALSHQDRRNDHEVELAIVIGKTARNVPREKSLEYVAGYCIGIDMTVRGPEERSFRKSPDSYTILGPWLVTRDEIDSPGELQMSLKVNGEVRQNANTSDLILGVEELVEFASSFYTLHPGDVIISGTPEGVGPVNPGDAMLAEIERIGTMTIAIRSV
uniref:Maleylpyruvate hydrolase n=1 Tax=Aquipseudomonas alcaligenes TaxID=43263 RepID=HBZF_AQUAC|nr:RecName: Full=Maleylpyruvate hydrolase; Short=MPH11 [Pseudomonas alcaligenes]ABD64512.1 putative maleylpyruvate isomerase [Pseudomonas alcaligenes]